uniref:UGGT thioredoxin-like domain-containing protein n=1 Tax=Amphimedon queenslandica TaxID=400682 RepID=A0A1X7THM3_AMPQE
MAPTFLCWLGVFFIFYETRVEANWASSPPISVKLKAQWNRSPLLLEASEYIAEIDERLFWQFVWQFRNLHQSSKTDKDQYESIMSAAKTMLVTPSDRLLSISLSLHTHSPAVQMFQQVSSEVYESLGGACDDVFININNRYVCNTEELNKELENINNNINSNSSDIQSFDHCYPFVSSLPTAILYGEIGTSRFSSFIELLWPKMEAGELRLCVRHFVLHKERDQLVLSGYGVQLAIKSTEYKAMDDTKVKEGDGSKSVDEADLIHEVGGFNFTRLKERYGALGSQLDDFKKHLLDQKKDLPQLKAWEVSDLGVQTVQSVLESEFPWNTLQEISHNLPVIAKTLSRLPVSRDVKTDIAYNQRVLQQVGVAPGDSVLLLNGLILQEDDMNVFSILDYLKRESRLLSGLEGLGIPSKYFVQMVSLAVHPQHSTFAVDMRNESVLFINNIEEDKRYSRWPSSVTEFLRPAFPGTLRQIRKNAFTIEHGHRLAFS